MSDVAALPHDAAPVAYEGAARLITAEQEAQAFWRLRTRMLATRIRHTLATARLRVVLVALLSLVFWVGLYLLFFEGFRFLQSYVGTAGVLHAQTVQAIYNIFFASLMVMLFFSSGIILYGGLFRSPETDFLLTLPVRSERVVLYKFQEAVIFSSWGFLLLGSPMLVAYGVVAKAGMLYYLLLLPFIVGFAYIPCAVGALACLAIVRHVPRLRLQVVGIALLVVLVAGIAVAWSVVRGPESDLLTAGWFQQTLGRLRFSEHRLSPSWWLSTGLLEAGRQPHPGGSDNPQAQAILFLALLLSNAMLLHVVTLWYGRRVFRAAYSELSSGRTRRRPAAVAWIDRAALRGMFFLPAGVRHLIVKDLRVFRRDPVQWSQFLIFFGLLALYFLNVRRFSYDANISGWVNMISFLNLAVVGLILSTFTTRFIFPMISLEGSRFWILGLLPIDRDTILWGKFLFATVGAVIPCTVLILLSDVMLRIPLLVLLVHQLCCLLLCIGLAAIAVGLGARMPDLQEQSPSKIAAGFGGTLNLVISAVYIIAVVLLTALPCHFYVADKNTHLSERLLGTGNLLWWLLAGVGSAIALGVAATVIPLRIGLKAFREMEF